MRKYLGIPYVDKGRDENGLDCYGLVYLYYKNEYGIELETFTQDYESASDAITAHGAIEKHRDEFLEVDKPREGDLIIFTIGGFNAHIGLMISDKKFLHTLDGCEVTVESIDSITWRNRINSYLRFKT